ncbi:hypothetical protein K432DRAFT_409132 [Lepidopterella palustris CBS 459.81]|uniref:Secreted protein n=1 Tax=Lepidopterella palustris CBS 459.81 TaxID=1314670 RepID=A0A8E2JAY8_9PEZI|nr:hypothetical protein K432DRAFT_409132 [Lepidopterella palustris CBS 459.81]
MYFASLLALAFRAMTMRVTPAALAGTGYHTTTLAPRHLGCQKYKDCAGHIWKDGGYKGTHAEIPSGNVCVNLWEFGLDREIESAQILPGYACKGYTKPDCQGQHAVWGGPKMADWVMLETKNALRSVDCWRWN